MANQLDHFFAALSDPTRRAVIEHLATGPASVSDLAEPHDMALPSFLKHLNKLEAAGLVRSIKTGRTRMVHLEPAPMDAATDWLARQRGLWSRRLDRLDAIATRIAKDTQ